MKSPYRGAWRYSALALWLAGTALAYAAPVPPDPLEAGRCFATPATLTYGSPPPYSTSAAQDAPAMSNLYRAPTTSPHLDTLDIVSVGLSLDVYRQGQVWAQLQQQDAGEPNSLHVGSILPTDPQKYPVTADDKDAAYDKREADALELGLRDFPEAWPIPTVTVVRGYNAQAARLRNAPKDIQIMLRDMVGDLKSDAGLHWHNINQLQNGEICNDTPEGVVEEIFQVFEAHPDMPALLVYADDGYNMAGALSSYDTKVIGATGGPRQPGELTDTMIALVVARPERMDWLRYYAGFAKPNPNPIDPWFSGWKRHPKVDFVPSPFIPTPWTKRGFEQWDALKILAQLHRPVTVSLNDANGQRLRNEALTGALAEGWTKATDGIAPPPARLFFDSGTPNQPLAELMPALKAANSPLNLLQSNESYDLTQRLGDTGAASPFVGIVLATMASYRNSDTSMVMPMRRGDQVTLIAITSATPGKKPTSDPFGVNLMAQTASSETPSAIIAAQLAAEHRAAAPPEQVLLGPNAAEREAARRQLNDFLVDGTYIDPLKPKE